MTSRGRKEDMIWQHFVKKKVTGNIGYRAICKKCNKEMQGLVDRLKRHWESCSNNESIADQPSTSTSKSDEETPFQPTKKQQHENTSSSKNSNESGGRLSSFVVKTSQDKKKQLDKQIARAVFATNCSFRSIENKEVLKAIKMLRPGYVPPSRFQLSSTLLEEIFEEEKSKCCEKLYDSSVCMSLDGWSNIHNEPIICVVVTTEDGNSFLLESIDTSGHPHTGDYLTGIAVELIKKCKDEYNCKVTSFVTDNAANMNKMRQDIAESMNYFIIAYGCSAHILNLLSKDLKVTNVKEHIVQIVKYFRNTHLPNAWYKEKGGKKLVLPQNVRWNTLSDCFEVYVNEWPKILQICEEHKNEIDSVIYQKVSDIHIKRMAENFLKVLKPISVTLDRIQRKDCFLSQAVEEWKKLESVFDSLEENTNLEQIQCFKKRYDQALTPLHYLAYFF